MPRLPLNLPRPCTLTSLTLRQTRLISTTRPLSASEPSTTDSKTSTGAQDSGPGWGGREGRDHAVKRPAYDVQADTAQQGMKDHQEGKEGSDAISRKDENKSQQKAKEEFPESPDQIGMNDERGSKGH
ncbi:hypothetical protein H2200_002075 [Cladophialophora chaetospira]|uniref:Uncharacterized protein n=1 Tax=Cladophialophora chaetospira TaxID=386627 RepID=A0AA38XIA1_9EURO|nr:hypothetical protein H2200_002075 [Cladophialophora chaetospira]